MRFGILGPLEVAENGGRQLELGGRKQRAVLAILLLHPNEAVSSDRLVEDLWSGRPPGRAAASLQAYVSRLRRALREDGRIVTTAGGYLVRVASGELDSDRFERLVEEGRSALSSGDRELALRGLRDALGLWRGPPLGDFRYDSFAQEAISRLEEMRLAALEDRIDAELALGGGGALVGELEGLVREHPYREQLRGQLMLALYRGGRQTDALATYRELSGVLRDELGLEPGESLRELERAILRHDPSLATPAAAEWGGDAAPTGRASELPAGTVTFLFTDIEGSTRLLGELGSERYGEQLEIHRERIRVAVAAHSGVELGTEGDAFFIAFDRASDALSAANDAQAALADGPGRVRIGIHTGEPLLVDGNYVGLDVHKAARICAAAHGGQVLVSRTTRDLAGAELRDLGEHRLKDLPEPERLFQLGTADFPPLRAARPTNLPLPPAALIGRDREIDGVCGLLADPEVRLVTLVGSGGVGKTRLALAVADAIQPSFVDGVCWAGLAGVAAADHVGSTIARALGVIPAQGESVRQALTGYLAAKHLLLLIDNFEHVLDAAELVGELLQAGDGLVVLVTSREALDLGAEHRVTVHPLNVPAGSDAVSVAEVESTDATALFLAAARRRDERFEVTVENAPVIAEICIRLEGLPLALELAAARAGALGVAELGARLGPVLDHLGAGPRDAPARQRTLRATIEWSYRLLTEDEARGFVRFAVFAGGATLDAAQAVTDASAATFEALVDKSLIDRRRQAGGSSRFVMLETIREYALDLLADDPDQERVRRRHAEWFLEFAKQAEQHLRCADQPIWLSRLREETDNIRALLAWSLENDTGAGVDLAPTLWRGWMMQGQLHELIAWLERALADPTTTDPRTRAIGLREYGNALDRVLEYGRAWEALQESLELFRELGDRKCEAEVLLLLSMVAHDQGALEEALALANPALARFRELGEPWWVARALQILGGFFCDTRDFRRAASTLEEALARFDDLGDQLLIHMTAHDLGDVAVDQGDAERAGAFYRKSLTAAIEIGNQHGHYMCTAGLACVAALNGDVREAGRRWGAVEAAEKHLDNPMHGRERKRYLRILGPLSNDPRFQAGQKAGRDLPLDQAGHDLMTA